MADSSLAISGQPDCYVSDSSTDQCTGDKEEMDFINDGLNFCCGAITARESNALNWYYRLNGAVDCEACELIKSNYNF